MDKDRFKALLIRDKEWLQELYSSESALNRKRLLTTASDKKIDTLLKFLHLLANGEIKMHKENFEKLPERLVKLLRKSFEKKSALQKLLNGERDLKLKQLQKLVSVLPTLLYTLFNV